MSTYLWLWKILAKASTENIFKIWLMPSFALPCLHWLSFPCFLDKVVSCQCIFKKLIPHHIPEQIFFPIIGQYNDNKNRGKHVYYTIVTVRLAMKIIDPPPHIHPEILKINVLDGVDFYKHVLKFPLKIRTR